MNPFLYKLLFFIHRNLAWVLLLGFLLLLFGYMSHVIQKQDVQLAYAQAVYHDTQKELVGVKNILSQKENELGEQTTKVKAIVGEKQTLQMMFEAQNSAFAKQLADLRIEMKDLKSVTSLKVTTSGQFISVTKDSIVEKIVERRIGDTVRQETVVEKLQVINYKEPNGWFTMTGTIKGDTVKFNPVFYEQYEVAIHEHRKPKKHFLDFFRGKHTVGTVLNKNPYSKTTDVKVIVAEKERKGLFNLF